MKKRFIFVLISLAIFLTSCSAHKSLSNQLSSNHGLSNLSSNLSVGSSGGPHEITKQLALKKVKICLSVIVNANSYYYDTARSSSSINKNKTCWMVYMFESRKQEYSRYNHMPLEMFEVEIPTGKLYLCIGQSAIIPVDNISFIKLVGINVSYNKMESISNFVNHALSNNGYKINNNSNFCFAIIKRAKKKYYAFESMGEPKDSKYDIYLMDTSTKKVCLWDTTNDKLMPLKS